MHHIKMNKNINKGAVSCILLFINFVELKCRILNISFAQDDIKILKGRGQTIFSQL